MKTFGLLAVPDDQAAIPSFLRRLQAAILQAANRADPYVGLQYLAVAPTKPQDGIYLAAAGVLGANRGAYRYDASLGTYTFLA